MRKYLAKIFDLLRLNCIPSASAATILRHGARIFAQRLLRNRDDIAQIGHVHRRQIHEQFVTFLGCHRCVRRIQYRRRHFVAEQRFETRRFAADIERNYLVLREPEPKCVLRHQSAPSQPDDTQE